MKWGHWGAVRALTAAFAMVTCASAAWGQPPRSAEYWQAYETKLKAMGLMRTDRAPADVPYTNADLVRDFAAIMLHKEHSQRGGKFVKDAAPRRLKKLPAEVGVRISGSTLDTDDLANIHDMMARLTRVTGVKLVEGADDPRIRLMILTEPERQEFARRIAENPRWSFISQNVANDLGRAVCSTYYSRDRSRPRRFDYIIVIPAEVRGLLRQSCIEEEMGQAFGPGADSDEARPSIFNDDSEFALMTRHDEDLLRVLYDPRLEPGMTAAQAMPLVIQIVEELGPAK